MQLWTCGDQSADWQFWSFEQRGPGVFKIHNSQSGHRCLDANISGGPVRNGTAAQLWDCWETSNQLWYRYEVNGRTLWVNGGPGQKYCLDADSSSQLHNGTRIQLWECNINADWQSWVWAELP